MKELAMILVVAGVILAGTVPAQADSATAYVGTVNANGAFEVQNSGAQLYYDPQADTDYVWMNNNGSDPNVVATYTYESVTYDRDGMKTFACSDVAYGQRLDTIKLAFDYSTAPDPTTGYSMGSVAINFFITDGAGHYGIWSATSGAAHYTDTVTVDPNWTHRSLDCTALVDTDADFAIYEHNGFTDDSNQPYSRVTWDKIKDFTVAGFYDYQRTPEGGFEAWNETLWTDITNAADPNDTTLNEYGITINWGDTVGGCYEDGSGEIGASANRPYGQAGRLIRDYEITVGATTYDMTFEAGVIPEPATMSLLAIGGLLALMRRRRRRK